MQQAAYDDIRVMGTPGGPGSFLYGKPKKPAIVKLIWPIDKVYITQVFGANPAFYKPLKGHDGIDLRTRFWDSPLARRYIVAAADGQVEVRNSGKEGYGLHIRIRHDDGSLTIYGHLSKVYVPGWTRVKQGDRIGLTGNTGKSTAPHFHFELRPPNADPNNGYAGAIDPLPYLPPIPK